MGLVRARMGKRQPTLRRRVDEDQRGLRSSVPRSLAGWQRKILFGFEAERWRALRQTEAVGDGAEMVLRGTALVQLARLNKETILPELYFKAAGEMLFVLFASCWLVTLWTHPEAVASNPLKERLLYNNFCVGFDTAPARYLGQVLFAPVLFLVLQYVKHDMERAALLPRLAPWQRRMVWAVDLAYGASICIFGLVFVISPFDSVWGHSMPFMQYIIARYAVVLSHSLTCVRPSRGMWRFVQVYGAVSFLYPCVLATNYAMFDAGYGAAYVPWWFNMALDYAWFACLALTTHLVPHAEAVRRDISVEISPPPSPTEGEATELLSASS